MIMFVITGPTAPGRRMASGRIPMTRIGTAAFHAHSHHAKCTQPRPTKSGAGRSTRPEVSVTAFDAADSPAVVGAGGGVKYTRQACTVPMRHNTSPCVAHEEVSVLR